MALFYNKDGKLIPITSNAVNFNVTEIKEDLADIKSKIPKTTNSTDNQLVNQTYVKDALLNVVNTLESTTLNISGNNGTSDGVSNLINKLPVGESTPVDNDYYVAQFAGGGTTTVSFYRRPLKALWEYIKNKLKSTSVEANTINVTKELKIPTSAPSNPQNGDIWIE